VGDMFPMVQYFLDNNAIFSKNIDKESISINILSKMCKGKPPSGTVLCLLKAFETFLTILKYFCNETLRKLIIKIH